MLRNFKIGARLNFAFAIIIVLIAVLVGVGMFEISNLIRATGAIKNANDLRSDIRQINDALVSMLLLNDEQSRVEHKKEYEKFKADLPVQLQNIESRASDSGIKADIDKLKELTAKAIKADDQVVDFVDSEMMEIGLNSYLANLKDVESILELCDSVVANYDREINSTATQAKVLFIVVGIIILVFSLLVALLIKNSILTPIRHGVFISERLSVGDLTVEVNADGKDELSFLMQTIKGMVGNLRKIISDIKEASNNIASASTQLSSSAEEISQTMNDTSSHASQIATSSEEMSQTVIDIAKNASSMSDSSTTTSNIAKNGEQLMERSVTEVREIANTVEDSAKIISTLSDRSRQIGEIVNVINDIADQTNLLALNAAIEAARAGEQGRGFAVVADEVRKLAERTARSTSEINAMIHSIQSEVAGAVSSMDDIRKKVDIGVDLSSQTGSELKKIVSSIANLQSMVQTIAASTEEMSATADHISSDVSDVARSSKEIASGSNQISDASNSLAMLATRLQTTVNMFKV